MLLSCFVNNQSVNLSPVFNSIAALYKAEEELTFSLLNYSSTIEAQSGEDEKSKALLETDEHILKVDKKLDDLKNELEKMHDGKNIGGLMAQAINTSFSLKNTEGFSEAKNLDFNKQAQDLDLYYASDIFAGLLVCLDKLFTMSISLKEIHPEAEALKPKSIRDLQNNLDDLMLTMHNVIKPITTDLALTAIDNMKDALLDKPTLMNRKKIDSINSVIRFLHSSKDSLR